MAWVILTVLQSCFILQCFTCEKHITINHCFKSRYILNFLVQKFSFQSNLHIHSKLLNRQTLTLFAEFVRCFFFGILKSSLCLLKAGLEWVSCFDGAWGLLVGFLLSILVCLNLFEICSFVKSFKSMNENLWLFFFLAV